MVTHKANHEHQSCLVEVWEHFDNFFQMIHLIWDILIIHQYLKWLERENGNFERRKESFYQIYLSAGLLAMM